MHKIKRYGIPKLVDEGREFDFVVISPQCPSNLDWASENWFLSTFEDVITKYRINTNRVYLTGLSLGGKGTWYIAEQYPDHFAAIVPVCGRTRQISSIRKNVNKLADMPNLVLLNFFLLIPTISKGSEESDKVFKFPVGQTQISKFLHVYVLWHLGIWPVSHVPCVVKSNYVKQRLKNTIVHVRSSYCNIAKSWHTTSLN